MRYWWVNHGRTSEAERTGGFLWSPKTDKRGAKLRAYDNMTRMTPGDPVLSYAHARVEALGRVTEAAVDAVIPETHRARAPWAKDGWRVGVEWALCPSPYSPRADIDVIRPMLGQKYSPINLANGNGNQGYLYEVGEDLYRHVILKAGIR